MAKPKDKAAAKPAIVDSGSLADKAVIVDLSPTAPAPIAAPPVVTTNEDPGWVDHILRAIESSYENGNASLVPHVWPRPEGDLRSCCEIPTEDEARALVLRVKKAVPPAKITLAQLDGVHLVEVSPHVTDYTSRKLTELCGGPIKISKLPEMAEWNDYAFQAAYALFTPGTTLANEWMHKVVSATNPAGYLVSQWIRITDRWIASFTAPFDDDQGSPEAYHHEEERIAAAQRKMWDKEREEEEAREAAIWARNSRAKTSE